eukprot:sb/3467298/
METADANKPVSMETADANNPVSVETADANNPVSMETADANDPVSMETADANNPVPVETKTGGNSVKGATDEQQLDIVDDEVDLEIEIGSPAAEDKTEEDKATSDLKCELPTHDEVSAKIPEEVKKVSSSIKHLKVAISHDLDVFISSIPVPRLGSGNQTDLTHSAVEEFFLSLKIAEFIADVESLASIFSCLPPYTSPSFLFKFTVGEEAGNRQKFYKVSTLLPSTTVDAETVKHDVYTRFGQAFAIPVTLWFYVGTRRLFTVYDVKGQGDYLFAILTIYADPLVQILETLGWCSERNLSQV